MDTFPRYIKPLDSSTDLDVVGGKGRSLAAMLRAGLPVPAGFHVTISAYQRFIEHNDIARAILELATPVVVGARASFEKPSTRVMKLFERGEIPSDIADEIANAYAALDRDQVAVRSSANAEDLPNLSFAGQQETYLNVYGHDDLLIAVKNCWASLWTTQALSYRHEMDVDQGAVAMAVIIQAMVPADVSGILFTANPATGQRDQAIVNCSYGLGEAVVGGQVTPDTFVFDKASLKLKETVLGSKEQMIVSRSTQGTHLQQVPREQRDTSSLSENSLKDLVSLAKEVEHCFVGQPQDIEWA
ncbi:MAG: PEP/pyruvate-binding domain-containing protein, partial [Pseudomonadota bacterium]|nr:PEP/pyruvate-binding domain-containing protein [Pseudomonadota bacterium]